MSYNSNSLNDAGEAMCISCRKKFSVRELEHCALCQKFLCKSCATYRKQGNPHGYVCKGCMGKLK